MRKKERKMKGVQGIPHQLYDKYLSDREYTDKKKKLDISNCKDRKQNIE